MLSRKFIYHSHKLRATGKLTNHARQSANVLSRLTFELSKHPLPHNLDFQYPFHLIIYCNGKISAHCSGFDKRIDIQRLTCSGKPNHHYKEIGFMTPKGAVNYILKKWGKPKNTK